MTRWTSAVSVLVSAVVAATPADVGAQSRPLPSLADVNTHARAVVVAFNGALEQGDFGQVHPLLHNDLQTSLTPEAMKQNFARFVRDKMYARALTKDQLVFTEEPLLFDETYLVLKTSAPGRSKTFGRSLSDRP